MTNSTNNPPLISVIIPVYNGERYVAEAIQSVLDQDYQPIEIIVLNDGSTDGTSAVVDQFGGQVRQCYQANHGLGDARNKGVEASHGNYVAFLDADDLWTPQKLSLQMEAMTANRDVDICFGDVAQFVSPELQEEKTRDLHANKKPQRGHHPGTMLLHRRTFDQVGPFRNDRQFGEFIDWYARATELSLEVYSIPHLVMKRRLHDSNMGIQKRDARQDYARVLGDVIRRRRKSNG